VIADAVPVVADDEPVIISGTTAVSNDTFIKYLIIFPVDVGVYKITFGEFTNTSFTDYESYAIIEAEPIKEAGAPFESYLETGFEIADDIVRFKQAPYLVSHLKRTETGYIISEDPETPPEWIKPSSCFVQARWEWSDSAASGRWSSRQQVYRIRASKVPEESTTEYDPGNAVVTSRSRLRGYGRALQLRFESEEGKDFDLLGWGVVFTGNSDP
jgi:hypothetical protein